MVCGLHSCDPCIQLSHKSKPANPSSSASIRSTCNKKQKLQAIEQFIHYSSQEAIHTFTNKQASKHASNSSHVRRNQIHLALILFPDSFLLYHPRNCLRWFRIGHDRRSRRLRFGLRRRRMRHEPPFDPERRRLGDTEPTNQSIMKESAVFQSRNEQPFGMDG